MTSKLLVSLALFSLSLQGLSAGEEEEIEMLFEEIERDAGSDEASSVLAPSLEEEVLPVQGAPVASDEDSLESDIASEESAAIQGEIALTESEKVALEEVVEILDFVQEPVEKAAEVVQEVKTPDLAPDSLEEKKNQHEISSAPLEGTSSIKKRNFSAPVAKSAEEPKRLKPHFAGAKPRASSASRKKSKKIPMRIKRESRTIPAGLTTKKEEAPVTVETKAVAPAPIKKIGSEGKSGLTPTQKLMLTADNQPSVRAAPPDQKQERASSCKDLKGENSSAYLTGEWLYWRTRQGGMEYAVARSSDTPGVFTDAVSKKVSFGWESGFKLGLGVHLPYDRWDIYVNYTQICPSHTSHADGSLFPLLSYQGQFPAANVSHAEAHWKIAFRTLDVELGRAYCLSPAIVLRPYIGMKGGWIDQDANVHYSGGAIPVGEIDHLKFNNDFKGAGVLMGADSNWELGDGFSLFGNLSAALLAGFYDLSHTQVQEGVKVINLNSDLHEISPMVQLAIGAAWDRNFGRYHFGLSAGFESQCWWQQNQLEHFTDQEQPIFVRQGDALSLYGLTVQARFDF